MRTGAQLALLVTLCAAPASAQVTRLEIMSREALNDGRFILYVVQSPTAGSDVCVLPLAGARTPRPIAHTAANESWGRFSPDGRWVAYSSDESGTN